MSKHPPAIRTADCKVCMVPHDDELHEATLNVRRWFHDEVVRRLEDYSDCAEMETPGEPARVA